MAVGLTLRYVLYPSTYITANARLFTESLLGNEKMTWNKRLTMYELARVVEVVALCLLANPKGFIAGVKSGAKWWAIEGLGQITGAIGRQLFTGSDDEIDEEPEMDFNEVRLQSWFIPMVEEVQCHITQKIFEWALQRFLGIVCQFFANNISANKGADFCLIRINSKDICNINIDSNSVSICGYQVTARKMAIFASAFLFVAGHNDRSWIVRFTMLPAALANRNLAHSHGIIASVASHMANNLLCGAGELAITHLPPNLEFSLGDLREKFEWMFLPKENSQNYI